MNANENMTSGTPDGWQIPLPKASLEARFDALLEALHRIGESQLANADFVQPSIGYDYRGLHTADEWDIGYVLTPWMLAHIFLPRRPPAPPSAVLPADWHANVRKNKLFQLLGPALDFVVGEEMPSLHVQWIADFGHFLFQPLILKLSRYSDAEAVWKAQSDVLEARERASRERLAEMKKQDAQLDRRAFLRRMLGNG